MLHYLKDVPATLKKIAEYIKPVDGTCLVLRYPHPREIWFKKALDQYPVQLGNELSDICDSLSLHCKMVEFKEHVEIEKKVWYEALRQRYTSTLNHFSDVEIEVGICELEEKLGSSKTLGFDFCVKAWIIKHP